jgi:cysteinyl-tRNA synthetase
LEKINNLVDKLNDEIKKNLTGVKPEFDFMLYKKRFEDAMDEDLNTSQAVAVIYDFVKDVNKVISSEENIDNTFYVAAKKFLFETAGNVLGIVDINKSALAGDDNLVNELIELLINLRMDAKQNKNYQLSDKIREGLKEIGIVLADGKEGTTYKITR